jgi:putative transposase
MSWTRIWIHLVFTTKDQAPILSREIRERMNHHIRENAVKQKIHLDSIGGYTDHLHCLISLSKDQSISKVVQLIKGESSSWLNKEFFKRSSFSWQDDYWAKSVDDRTVHYARKYIRNQEEHHGKKNFDDEMDEF